MKKKKKKIDAVGWKSYCSRLWSWARHRARGWADCAQQALGERACWACQARAAGGLERAWLAGRAGARRASVLGSAGGRRTSAGGRTGASGRTGAGRRARARASGNWAQEQADGRALGARQGAGRPAGRWARGRALGALQGAGRAAGRRWARGARGLGAWAGLGQCTRCTRPIFDPF